MREVDISIPLSRSDENGMGHSAAAAAAVTPVRGRGRRGRVHGRGRTIAVQAFCHVRSRVSDGSVKANRKRIHTLHTVVIAVVPLVVSRSIRGSGVVRARRSAHHGIFGHLGGFGSHHFPTIARLGVMLIHHGGGFHTVHLVITIHHGGRWVVSDGGPIRSPDSRLIYGAVGKWHCTRNRG